jgi:hypothetical protein
VEFPLPFKGLTAFSFGLSSGSRLVASLSNLGVEDRADIRALPSDSENEPCYVKGAGLGLRMSNEIVEVHGGKIWAESAGEGKGATFTFTLPRARSVRSRITVS